MLKGSRSMMNQTASIIQGISLSRIEKLEMAYGVVASLKTKKEAVLKAPPIDLLSTLMKRPKSTSLTVT
jgi:hypothetical protein